MDEQPKIVQRDAPEPADERRKNVLRWQDRVLQARHHWQPVFDRMRQNEVFARGDGQTRPGAPHSYVANVTARHVKQRTAALYARNPTVVAQRRPKLYGTVWDGRLETALAARQMMQASIQTMGAGAAPPFDPEALAAAQVVVAEVEEAERETVMLDRIGETMKLVFAHQISEQFPPFKDQMKGLFIRRAVICGVGYIKLGFQRKMKLTPDQERKINDVAQQLARIQQISADIADGEIDPNSAEADRLASLITAIRSNPEMLLREGLSFTFPHPSAIIPDRQLTSLAHFQGCDWVAEEFMLSRAAIQRIYGVDVGAAAMTYLRDRPRSEGGGLPSSVGDDGAPAPHAYSRSRNEQPDADEDKCFRVWEVWDKCDGLVFTLCEGHPDFLDEPTPPDAWTERFWPWFAFAPNVMDTAENPFPVSDVDHMRPMQGELNRSREALREHRFAARPKVITPTGMLDPEDKDRLTDHQAAGVPIIEVKALAPGQKIEDVLQSWAGPGIDPNLYDTSPIYEDILRVVGTAESSLGGVNGASATENVLADSARQLDQTADIDDIDGVLSDLARAGGQILLANMSEATVREIAGRGAVWPTQTRDQIAKELYLEVEAGSSGRPNMAAELQVIERGLPLLMQLPGLSAHKLARRAVRVLDPDARIEDYMEPGALSITAQNAVAQKVFGEPAGGGFDPNATGQEAGADAPAEQGAEGGSNAPRTEPGPRPQPGDAPSVQRSMTPPMQFG